MLLSLLRCWAQLGNSSGSMTMLILPEIFSSCNCSGSFEFKNTWAAFCVWIYNLSKSFPWLHFLFLCQNKQADLSMWLWWIVLCMSFCTEFVIMLKGWSWEPWFCISFFWFTFVSDILRLHLQLLCSSQPQGRFCCLWRESMFALLPARRHLLLKTLKVSQIFSKICIWLCLVSCVDLLTFGQKIYNHFCGVAGW